MNDQQALREADRAQAHRDELTQRISQAIRHDGTIEPLKGLHFNRSSLPSECVHSVSIPAFCVIAEGSKKVLLGNVSYQYDPMHYLLATIELPIVRQILEGSKAQPYLSLPLDLDPTLVGSLMVEAGDFSPQRGANLKAIDVSLLDVPLLDADYTCSFLVSTELSAALRVCQAKVAHLTRIGYRETPCMILSFSNGCSN